MNASVKDKAVLVTGGASGIGRATVERLLSDGWRVVAADRDQAALKALLEDSRLITAPLDVTDEAMVEALVAKVEVEFGPIGGLVNSAGIGRDVPFAETTAKLFRDIYEINVIGAFLVSKAVARSMVATGGGSIVNIASVSGIRGNIGRAAYGASKGALIQLTRVMAVELADDGIRVNAVAPGPIETPMVAAVHTEKIREQWHKTVPLRRYGEPEEIAGAVSALLDPRFSSYITGQTIAADGGFTAAGIMEH
jgi:NAD(P)-dependent dehydrogenase (short-subunit alcohol dehydrogenase family)